VDVALFATAGSPASQSFSLALSAPDGNASLGAVDEATVTIRNHQSLVQFAAGTYTVDADLGTVTLTLNRTGNTSLAASVDYATAAGTAAAGTDYNSTSGTVGFLSGQLTRTVTVSVHVHPSGP